MMVQRLPSNGWWHRSRGCGANIHSERTAKISRSVSVSKSHRQETRMDLPLSEPAAESESARENRNQPGQTGARRPAKRLWKRRSLRELGNPFGIPTFPQPQQQQALFGYISNGSTGIARVTFLDGLTRPSQTLSDFAVNFHVVLPLVAFAYRPGKPLGYTRRYAILGVSDNDHTCFDYLPCLSAGRAVRQLGSDDPNRERYRVRFGRSCAVCGSGVLICAVHLQICAA